MKKKKKRLVDELLRVTKNFEKKGFSFAFNDRYYANVWWFEGNIKIEYWNGFKRKQYSLVKNIPNNLLTLLIQEFTKRNEKTEK